MRRSTNIILATTSFIGGFAAGLLLAPKKGKQNRAWVSDHATELVNWVDSGQQNARRLSNAKLYRIRKNVKQGLRKNIPNLFEATKTIDLGNNDAISE